MDELYERDARYRQYEVELKKLEVKYRDVHYRVRLLNGTYREATPEENVQFRRLEPGSVPPNVERM